MNPFEVEKWPETSVGTHIDLLRSVFNASFGMWTPLPQVLEECLHRIYKDRGWDIVTNQNHRLTDCKEIASAFPTLSDLVAKIDKVTKELGYDKEAEERVRASLLTRINSLRVGGKGCMLDVQRSLPMEMLLKESIILELEGMGDDDDKAFIMGLLLIRLAEYRRQEHGGKELQHLLVFEEAHRLLANVSTQSSEEQSNPRGKAVESFANMLSEIRSYGQGVIIADQVPVKLAPDVIKNTNLKIAHRVLAQDDRQVLAGSMAMNKRQASALAILTIRKEEKVAEAAVFSEGDDIPVLVGVPEVEEGDLVPTAEKIRRTWEELKEQHGMHSIFQTYPTCQTHCDQGNPGCISARMISEVPAVRDTFAMFILSLITKSLYLDDDEVPELFNVLFSLVKREILPHISTPGNETTQMRCVLTHALYQNMEKYGALYGWTFDSIEYMIPLLLRALTEIVDENREISHDAAEKLVQFCHEYRQQCQRVGPFYGCEQVCQGICFFRYHVKPFTEDKETEKIFRNSLKEDEWETRFQNLYNDLIDQILLPLDDKMNREQLILCFVIQMTAGLRDYNWNQKQTIVDQMVTHIMNIH